MRLHRLYLNYNKFSKLYTMEVEVGNDIQSVKFQIPDNESRKILAPLVGAICDACAVSASQLKKECLSELQGVEYDR